ncbi:DNA cytosine methyltransferase [Marinitenerispora sediminis]|uniref:DNA (cytosine-5-)-methyltransferase n=1 Tax=Marinitenerispora sediminis TaxID=1931232 RepID=A0A368T552_9ACTN|nr:DNA cytosine methyltransferase [Marinitenerispora sediminis]RCV51408.1 DNA (cytosine-5-)-methyltransferase [Marinitenerispora sediminis]RCV57222.1 DNA (cytosine-5-)-methyltransferase [Marinitenerispora sediminis]RCV58576.1 DNA (cytosine-5-)-methyltransferase [Marinitenerispora sediminis]
MERTSVELFAGGGGLVQASTNAGFRHLLLNEFAPWACKTLEENDFERYEEGERPPVPEPGEKPPLVAGDVRKLEMEYLREWGVDLLAGGPPCQPFSLGGIAKGDEDQRNMFPEMFRAVREIQPKAVVCENVRGLLRPSFAPYFEYIRRELMLPFVERKEGASWQEHDRALGERLDAGDVDPSRRYEVLKVAVNAADYGVPQVRNRVLLVAFRADLGVDMDAFAQAVRPTHSEDLLIRALRNGSYWEDHPAVERHVRDRVLARYKDAPPLDELPLEDDPRVSRWLTLRDALVGLPPIDRAKLDKKSEQGGIPDHVGWPGARIYDGHTPNELDKPAKTVKAGVHGVPGGESVMLLDDREENPDAPGELRYVYRYMTVRETARVMTFGDKWQLRGPRGERMRQLGNAVPVRLGEVFAKAVAGALDKAESRS